MPTKKKPKQKRGQLSRAAALVHEINTTLKLERGLTLGNDPRFQIARIPTGSLVLDRITGGGFALGRHVELFGDESACKSFILYCTMAASQARGNLCALIDPEKSFDSDWFDKLGGDSESLILEQPSDAEEAIAVMMTLSKHATAHKLEVIGIDSIASMLPREELDNDPRDNDRIAPQARMMSRALRRITSTNDKVLFLWTNQERTNVGITFGNPKTTPGGRAMRFYATTRVEMRRGGIIKRSRNVARGGKLVKKEIAVGRWIQVRVEKDKSTRPYREGSFIFDGDMEAIDIASEVVHLGLEDGIITMRGKNYVYEDVEGVEWSYMEKKFYKVIRENEELRSEIVAEIQDNTQRIRNHAE